MIYIIIPVFNRKNFTEKCLQALSMQTFNSFKTIVVNDGSTDGTAELLKNSYPEVIELKGDGNLFWTASINMGVQHALKNGATYILTLNNDTIPLDNFVENMAKWAKIKPKALFGAMAYDASTKKPDYIGEKINWINASYNPIKYEKKDYVGIHEVTHFPGRGLLIPKDVFEKIGLYDEKRLPQYLADYDFTHRAVKAGFKIYCNFEAKIFVFPEESVGEQLRVNKSIKKYFDHLFGIRSSSNIIYFSRYAIKNAPKKYLLSFLAIGIVKRVAGYLTDWVNPQNNNLKLTTSKSNKP